MARLILQLFFAGALCATARADAPAAPAQRAVYLVVGADAQQRTRVEPLAAAWAASQPRPPAELVEPLATPPAANFPRTRLALLSDVERALLEARELSAGLREAAALRVLEAAEAQLLDALELPGAHAYLAEVYVQLGLCAAQLGAQGLAESALARAFSIDRTRRVEAAETPPATLALARRLVLAQAARPGSETPVEVAPPAALLWLDGVAQPAAGAPLRAPAGVHLLVARAPGYAPYATLLSLEPGRRAALQIALSPLPGEHEKSALLAARGDPPAARLRAAALAAAQPGAVYLVEAGPGPQARALIERCDAAGCSLLEGRDARRAQQFRVSADAQHWLGAGPLPAAQRPDARPLWRRWPVWAAAAAVAVAAGVGTALVLKRDASTHHQRELEIDPGRLPP